MVHEYEVAVIPTNKTWAEVFDCLTTLGKKFDPSLRVRWDTGEAYRAVAPQVTLWFRFAQGGLKVVLEVAETHLPLSDYAKGRAERLLDAVCLWLGVDKVSVCYEQMAHSLLYSREVMCRYYPDYNPETARKIVVKLPELYAEFEQGRMRWTHETIAEGLDLERETVSRYLSAFKKAGVTKIGVIPIP